MQISTFLANKEAKTRKREGAVIQTDESPKPPSKKTHDDVDSVGLDDIDPTVPASISDATLAQLSKEVAFRSSTTDLITTGPMKMMECETMNKAMNETTTVEKNGSRIPARKPATVTNAEASLTLQRGLCPEYY
jgi:hypothetical protein